VKTQFWTIASAGPFQQSFSYRTIDCHQIFLKVCCSVEIISLTPRFNAVNHERTKEKPFKRFFSSHTFRTRLKPGVNEKISTQQLPSLPVSAASSRRLVGELAARCRHHWQPRWLPPLFQTAS
jgi:hypothetical protein